MPMINSICYHVLSTAESQITGGKSELDCLLSILRALMMGETAGEEPRTNTHIHHQSHQSWVSEVTQHLRLNLHKQVTVNTSFMHTKYDAHTFICIDLSVI